MRHHIAKLFQLEGVLIDRWGWEGKRLVIAVRAPARNAPCPRCGAKSMRVHQRYRRRVSHGRWGDTLVFLEIAKRRFLCRSCSRPFTEPIPGIQSRARTTEHGKRQVVTLLKSSTCVQVGRLVRRDPATVARYLADVAPPALLRFPRRGPIRLGIDGHTMTSRGEVVTITELRTRRPITILADAHKETLMAFFRSIPGGIRARICEVVLDMEAGNAAAVREVFGPSVRITVDHFHLIQESNRALDEVRRAIQSIHHVSIPKMAWLRAQERLRTRDIRVIEEWGERFPTLFQLWVAKERIRSLYLLPNRVIAERRLTGIIADLARLESLRAHALARTLHRWRNEILNYFDHRSTNAYTEGIHRKLKLLQRTAYGFRNFSNYLLRATLVLQPLWLILNHTIYS